jgi:hypothetical protein
MCPVVVETNLQIGRRVECMLPTPQQIAATDPDLQPPRGPGSTDDIDGRGDQSDLAVVIIPLIREDIARAHLPVAAEPQVSQLPIVRAGPGRIEFRILIGKFPEDAVVGLVGELPSIASGRDDALLRPRTRLNVSALGFLCGFGIDVDYTIDGVRSPQGTSGTADDFNAIDVLHEIVLNVPEHT